MKFTYILGMKNINFNHYNKSSIICKNYLLNSKATLVANTIMYLLLQTFSLENEQNGYSLIIFFIILESL